VGRGGAFVLAAGRLAFCGGFDLDDPEILAEAAAAAGIPLDACLHAAGDPHHDGAMEGAGRRLLAAGADRLPALRIGRSLFWGEQRVGAAAAAVRQSSGAVFARG
jgi:2-hydroxychromene-2-carboxylate isomerase